MFEQADPASVLMKREEPFAVKTSISQWRIVPSPLLTARQLPGSLNAAIYVHEPKYL